MPRVDYNTQYGMRDVVQVPHFLAPVPQASRRNVGIDGGIFSVPAELAGGQF